MDEVIEYLQGTCKSIDEALNECLDDEEVQWMSDVENEMEFCGFIDERIFNCARCGWWCETGDWITDEDPNWDPSEETCTQCGNE